MSKCNTRHTSTTRVPLEERERHPHRSGQEYEYGETPQTGLGGGGGGADPDAQCARTDDAADASIDSGASPGSTRQNDGSVEKRGFARNRDEKHPVPNGGRRAKLDDQHERPDIQGTHGVPPEVRGDR